ncbi:PadR family transcriptional regulator [Bacillus thermotolerans]|uniref:PadR family transcriptional regulator n=1 Tax=Bacillus thermotolerans TaxID=1221996 RepID=UPI000588EC5C|nr:PadR family transcriptional regulator [Bacillus thermotolerans]KKB39001.1 transcriptional regulator, PadR family domain protein [Bacillus thermotolerans]
MSLSLFILGSLAEENSHPYKLKKVLLDTIPIDKMSEGKFYYNFEALQKKGLIEPVETIQIEKRPNKTLYRITEDGRQFLEQEIYNSFKRVSKVEDLYISIYLLKYADPVKAAFCLEDAIQQEKRRWAAYREARNNEELMKQFRLLDEKQQNAVEFISEHAFSQSDHNIRWMEKLLAFLKKIDD